MELGINYVAILIAGVASFFVGFLWYSVLFGKAWAKEMGISMDAKPSAGTMAKSLIMNFVGCFLLAFVFAHNNAAWSFVPGMDQMGIVGKIANAVGFTWLGFYLLVDLNTVAFEGRSWKLFFINSSYHFMILLVSALILFNM